MKKIQVEQNQEKLDELIKLDLHLHTDANSGELTNRYGLSEAALYFVCKNVEPGIQTIETGAGLSTMLFAALGAEHTCISFDRGSIERIQLESQKIGLSLDRVTFEVDNSAFVLPRLAVERQNQFEFALLDGGHGFPMPMIDFYYISLCLKKSARIILDDTNVWSVKLLGEYMSESGSWKSILPSEYLVGTENDLREADENLPVHRFQTFEKLTDGSPDLFLPWPQQPFVAKRSLGAEYHRPIQSEHELVDSESSF